MELDVEGEACRGHLHPALDGPPLGYGVEARVDLDRLEALGIPGEAVAGREAGRVPLLDEAGVGPARGTDVDGATHGATVPAPHTRWSSARRDPGRARRKTATFSRFMVSLRVGHAPRPRWRSAAPPSERVRGRRHGTQVVGAPSGQRYPAPRGDSPLRSHVPLAARLRAPHPPRLDVTHLADRQVGSLEA